VFTIEQKQLVTTNLPHAESTLSTMCQYRSGQNSFIVIIIIIILNVYSAYYRKRT